jgi:flagellin
VASTADLVTNINAAIQTAAQGATGADAAFKAANITASIVTTASGKQELAFNSSNAAFQVTTGDATANALLGSFSNPATGVGTVGAGAIALVSGGASELGTAATATVPATSADLTFAAASTAAQTISINATDATGTQHGITINLPSGTAALTGAGGVLDLINQKLQQSDDSTLQQITAVQTGSTASTTFNFVSTLNNFTVNVGADANAVAGSEGVTNAYMTANNGAGDTVQAVQVGTGSSLDISTLAGATAAVSAVSAAVSSLGTAQAAIGKGENQLNYAINLASSQITNFSAAESQIRDADVAAQAANLTKAQTLQQAAIAAMAQANSAPQAVLTLLKG